MLNFVFDFGNLKKDDEEKYIKSIIAQGFKELPKFFLLQNEDLSNLFNFSVKKVIFAHNFIREKLFSAAVSLREIRRYIIIFSWFSSFISNTINVFEEIFKKYNISIGKSCVLLSIYICYFIRLSNKNLRNEFNELISKEINFHEFIIIK